MDTTDAAAAPPEAPIAARGSQSKLSAALFFVVLAAILFRVVTAVTDRPAGEGPGASAGEHGPPPLVQWVPLEKAAAAAKTVGKPTLYDFTAAVVRALPSPRRRRAGATPRWPASPITDSSPPASWIASARRAGTRRSSRTFSTGTTSSRSRR